MRFTYFFFFIWRFGRRFSIATILFLFYMTVNNRFLFRIFFIIFITLQAIVVVSCSTLNRLQLKRYAKVDVFYIWFCH